MGLYRRSDLSSVGNNMVEELEITLLPILSKYYLTEDCDRDEIYRLVNEWMLLKLSILETNNKSATIEKWQF